MIIKTKKKCPKCGITKKPTDFYISRKRSDGLRSTCKECEAKARLSNDSRKYMREYHRNHDYARTSTAVRNAVNRGHMKQGKCLICGSNETEGHHWDYNRRLDVIWLCKKHHTEHHMIETEIKNRALKSGGIR